MHFKNKFNSKMFKPSTLFTANKASGVNVEDCKRLVEFKAGSVIIPSMQRESLFLDKIKSESKA